MEGTGNEIKYSDLIRPDDSIEKLISQLERLHKSFGAMVNSVKEGAREVSASMKLMSGATHDGKNDIERAVATTSKLEAANKELKAIMSDTSKQLNFLKNNYTDINAASKQQAKQLKELISAYDGIKAKVDANVKIWDSLTKAFKHNVDGGNEVIKTLSEIKTKLGELDSKMLSTISSMSKANGATKKAAGASNDLANAQARLAKAQSKENSEIIELNLKTSELNKLAKLEIQLANAKAGSYDKLSAQYQINKIKLNAMSDSMRHATEEGKNLEKETAKIYEKMKQLQAATGKHQLNVGNYPGGGFLGSAFGGPAGSKVAGGLIQSFAGSVGASGLGAGVAGLGAAAGPMAAGAAAVAALGAAMVDGISTAKDYEKSLSVLAAVTGENKENLGELADKARELGASTRYTATEVVELETELAKLGYAKNDIVNMTDSVLYFAQATGASLADASSLTGAALRMFGADSEQAGEYVDKMAAATTKSALSFEYLNTAMSIVSPVANAFGFNIEEVLSLLGGLANAGFDASSAATATRNIILNLADSNGKLAQSLGAPVTNLDELLQGLKKLNAEGVGLNETLQLTDKRSVAQFNTFLSGIDTVDDLNKALSDCNGTAEKMASTMADNLEGDVASLGSAWDDFMIELNDGQSILREIVQALTSAVRAISGWYKDCKQNFTDLWEQSAIFRAYMTTLGEEIKIPFLIVVDVLKAVWAELSGIGKMAKGLLTLDWDTFAEGFSDTVSALPDMYKEIYNDIADGVSNVIDAFNEDPKNTLIVKTDTEQPEAPSPAPAPGGKPIGKKLSEKELKELRKKQEQEAKEKENQYKRELSIRRKAEDAQTNLIEDEYEKRRIKINLQYSRQIEDLRHTLATEKNLTAKEISDMNATILALQRAQNSELIKLMEQSLIDDLAREKAAITAKLEVTREGSEEYLKLKQREIELEKQIALSKNEQLPEAKRTEQSTIIAKAEQDSRAAVDIYKDAQLEIFDQQQDLAQSEFDLLRNSELKKTEFRLNAEKERLKKILELNELAGNKLSEIERKTIENQIAKINKEIEINKKKGDIYDAFGLNLDSEAKDAINTSISFATDALNSWMAKRAEAANNAVALANKEVENAQNLLNAEIEARNKGLANSVENAQKQLDNAKKTQREALKEQKKAQKQQAALQGLEQAGNLITATSAIWAGLGAWPPAAIAAIGVMWASFAASKIMAAKQTKSETYGDGTIELLQGGSHASGHDIDLGTKSDGTKRRAEGGEYFAIINKRNSAKYRSEIPKIIDAFNNGTFYSTLDKFGNSGDANNNIIINTDLAPLEGIANNIAANQKNRTYIENGYTVKEFKNVKRTEK